MYISPINYQPMPLIKKTQNINFQGQKTSVNSSFTPRTERFGDIFNYEEFISEDVLKKLSELAGFDVKERLKSVQNIYVERRLKSIENDGSVTYDCNIYEPDLMGMLPIKHNIATLKFNSNGTASAFIYSTGTKTDNNTTFHVRFDSTGKAYSYQIGGFLYGDGKLYANGNGEKIDLAEFYDINNMVSTTGIAPKAAFTPHEPSIAKRYHFDNLGSRISDEVAKNLLDLTTLDIRQRVIDAESQDLFVHLSPICANGRHEIKVSNRRTLENIMTIYRKSRGNLEIELWDCNLKINMLLDANGKIYGYRINYKDKDFCTNEQGLLIPEAIYLRNRNIVNENGTIPKSGMESYGGPFLSMVNR